MAMSGALQIQLCIKFFYKYMNSYFSITLWIQKTVKMSSTHWGGLTHLQTRQSQRVAHFAFKKLRIQA